jgi:hypothetical protein
VQLLNEKNIRKNKLNEIALYNHYIRDGDSKFVANRKAKIAIKRLSDKKN